MTNPAQTALPHHQFSPRPPMINFKRLSLKKLIISTLLIVAMIFVWQWISSPMVVTVQGLGEVTVPATSATISLTVAANSTTASASIDTVKDKANSIRTLLIASGVLENDISESQLVSYPAGLVTVGAEGFESSIQMTAKTTDIDEVGELVGNLYNAGAALVNQPVLNVENQEKLEEQATKEALKEARAQAMSIALKNFKFIKKMVALSEQTSETTSTSSVKPGLFSQDFSETAAKETFKFAKLVTVSYKMW
jgi:uncharacterized protein YggE